MPNDVVHFYFLDAGDGGSAGFDGLPEDAEFRYIFVMMDDLTDFVLLEPAQPCTAEATGLYLVFWC